jgi:hypothetical protein
MKKVLSLAFIAAVLLLGCSADGFGSGENITWGKVCKVGDNCSEVQSAAQCENGQLVMRSECPD